VQALPRACDKEQKRSEENESATQPLQ